MAGIRAFSSEVETGSRKENASNQESRAPFRSYRNGKGSSGKGARNPGWSREGFAMARLAIPIAAFVLSLLGASAADAQGMSLTSADLKEGATISNEQVLKGYGCDGGKAIQFNSAVNPLVGLWCLKVQHDHILTKVSSAAHGTKRLDMNDVAQLPILLPSPRQQQLFVLAASNVVQNRERATLSGEAILSLFSSLQSRAFSGQL
jgi:hypothetical protein